MPLFPKALTGATKRSLSTVEFSGNVTTDSFDELKESFALHVVVVPPYFYFNRLPFTIAGQRHFMLSYWIRLKEESTTMEIISQHADKIKGVLSTFDRIMFKGHLLSLYQSNTQSYLLFSENVLLKDFGTYAKSRTSEVQAHAKTYARECGRPYFHVNSPRKSKEKKAFNLMKHDGIKEGLICVIGCLEMCSSFTTKKNAKSGKLQLVSEPRRALHVYFYYMDKELGFMHVRLETWFPFGIQIYINGREYLSRELDKANISYERYDNCFIDISDIKKAQEIADKMEEKKWCRTLDAFGKKVNPFLKHMKKIFSNAKASRYYWCFWQCEYATDVMFKSQQELELVYPDLSMPYFVLVVKTS